jgi:hypothetical protein
VASNTRRAAAVSASKAVAARACERGATIWVSKVAPNSRQLLARLVSGERDDPLGTELFGG